MLSAQITIWNKKLLHGWKYTIREIVEKCIFEVIDHFVYLSHRWLKIYSLNIYPPSHISMSTFLLDCDYLLNFGILVPRWVPLLRLEILTLPDTLYATPVLSRFILVFFCVQYLWYCLSMFFFFLSLFCRFLLFIFIMSRSLLTLQALKQWKLKCIMLSQYTSWFFTQA